MGKVNPKIDLVFKKLFGSEENTDILLSLINAILPLNQQIAKITLKNPYNVSDYAEGKLSILDIKAQDEQGKLFDIEMQIRGSKFYGKRALFYWAKMFSSQLDYVLDDNQDDDNTLEVGYSDLKKCIVISLMDFNFFEDKEYQHFYTLKDNKTNEQHKDLDYLDLYFIELKKYKGKLENLQTMLERWITFLNNAYKYDNKTLPQELAQIKEIRKATQTLQTMYLDEQEKRYYESQKKFWLDQEAFVKETIDKVVEQAELNKQIENAKNGILKGYNNQIITDITGLSIEQVEQLRHKKQ
ncbi:MAG: Rpn family recombination-promoting nuclease/putative transposase [Bacteroidetes bacterium]|nr:MAG: Rpn family recombination-promoting nuclease/putative transposase [Bacteroidota bacterium]TAG92240.1 MAG: Rpn family recombination-promoting nuclease/putative transposase [Bacteroidota bacterium]